METPTPVTREEVFLDAIAKGGGSSLPSTETASAGDVLSLDDNKDPQWAAPSGSGGGALVVNLTIDNSRNATADKTAAEIWAAAQSGVVVFTGSTAYLGFEGTFMRPLVDISHSDDGYGLTLGGSAFDLLVADTGSDYPAGTLI